MREKEIISYPELGHIYESDYFKDLPFDEYIDKNQPLPEGKPVFDIQDYGAAPDDLLNTEPIRLACEACRDAGGGVVLVAGGSYRTGRVRIYDNTTLFIAPDAELPAILTGYADRTKNGMPVRKAIHNIEITDYQIAYRDNEEILHIPAVFDEFLNDYPECNATVT